MMRAEMTRPSSRWGDPGAQRALVTGMRPASVASLGPHLAARTAFIDGQVVRAIDRGVTPVVILGAGYDDRALRFRTPGVGFYEVDHVVTHADKRRRLESMASDQSDLRLVAADFGADPVDRRLAAAGHDPRRSSVFVCEGLLVYLEEPTIVSLLSTLRSMAPVGSCLVATLAIHADGLRTEDVLLSANAARPNSAAEPWLTILTVDASAQLLTRSGWQTAETTDDVVLGDDAAPRRSINVVAMPGRRGTADH
jgi:methyltransferase (TIGR00027 family)